MKRYMDTVWLRGVCILSAILLGTSMGGAWQTASAENQTADLTGPIEGQSAEVVPLALAINGKSVVHVRTGNYTFLQGTNDFVPLTAAPEIVRLQSDAFTTSGKVVVTYGAECAVSAAAGNTETWVNIDMVLVNQATSAIITLPPSTNNTEDALCTSNGFAGLSGWRMASITGVATGLPLADYRVQVRANIQNGVAGNTGWLGDTSLVIRK